MLNPALHLAANMFEKPDKAATREGFGKGILEAGTADPRIVVLSADLTESTQAHFFAKAFPERFVEIGVAEQNLVTVAAGMANYGKIAFATSFATFNPGRNWEQIRTTIAINNVPVKVCGMHAGLQTGPDGATHQALEDMAMMRALPNMRVFSPCDAEEARKATIAVAKDLAPAYLRFGREKMPTMTTPETPFEIGKAQVFWTAEKPAAAIFATGPLLYSALLVAQELEKEGIEITVTNVHTIKPLDEETIVAEAKKAGAVVTLEEHQVHGGLGGAIAELLAAKSPTPMEFVGMQDTYGETGEAKELIEHFGMGVESIKAAVKRAIARK